MEGQQQQVRDHEEGAGSDAAEARRMPVWADHDQLPDEGAWLYVVDKQAWDEGRVVGAWVPADIEAHDAAMVVGSYGHEAVPRWELAIVDQVGCGEMVDEDHFVPMDHR